MRANHTRPHFAANRFRMLTMLLIVVLTSALVFGRLLAPVAADPSTPYPIRILANAEPSSLLLLTLVLLVMVLVDGRSERGRKATDSGRSEGDQRKLV